MNDALDARAFEARNAGHGIVEPGLDAVVIGREEVQSEVARRAVRKDRPRILLVQADEEAGPFLADVHADIGLAQDRQRRGAEPATLRNLVDWFCHHVLVRDDGVGEGYPEGSECRSGKDSRRAHNMLGDERARSGFDFPLARRQRFQSYGLGLAEESGAAGPGGLGQGLREVGGIEVAIDRQEERTGKTAWFHQRPERRGFAWGRDAGARGDTAWRVGKIREVAKVRGVEGKPQTARLAQANILAGFLFQRPQHAARVKPESGQRGAVGKATDVPRRVPSGAGRQIAALEQRQIRPALAGQVIENIAPDDTATDHDHPEVLRHVRMLTMRRHSHGFVVQAAA